MNIMDWPMGRIMQLPDELFGTKWVIGMSGVLAGAASIFDMAEIGLPDKCVIWEINVMSNYASGATFEVELAMGNVLPTTDAEFNGLPLVLPHIIGVSGNRGALLVSYINANMLTRLRQGVESPGIKLIARFRRIVGTSIGGTVNVVVSSIPREVPDWLVSGTGKNQK